MINNSFQSLLSQSFQWFQKRWANDCAGKKLQKVLNDHTINNRYKTVSFGIFGPVYHRTLELLKMKKEGKQLPFEELYFCNMGDPKVVGNKQITFYRQVIAAVAHPTLLTAKSFPPDVKCRASSILRQMRGNDAGAYANAGGIEYIRERIASTLTERDEKKCRPEDVYILNGATAGIEVMVSAFANEEQDKPNGLCYPVPMYPQYVAFINEYGLKGIEYYLREDNNWGVDLCRISEALNLAKKSCYPRALIVINPGNPTGQVLQKDNIKEILKFAQKEKLVLFADEVYWRNIYDPKSEFHALRKVAQEMGDPYDKLETVTFMSCSKGWAGECGIRGGVMVMENFDPEVQKRLNTLLSVQMCCNTLGQALVDADMNPPKEGDPSYELFIKQRNEFLCEMSKKAKLVEETYRKMEGFTVNPVQGAMYAFPKISLPPKLIEEANKKKIYPDEYYCLQILEKTGVCLSPGSTFGQDEGTYHFRTTILPPLKKFPKIMENMYKAHKEIVKKYS